MNKKQNETLEKLKDINAKLIECMDFISDYKKRFNKEPKEKTQEKEKLVLEISKTILDLEKY